MRLLAVRDGPAWMLLTVSTSYQAFAQLQEGSQTSRPPTGTGLNFSSLDILTLDFALRPSFKNANASRKADTLN